MHAYVWVKIIVNDISITIFKSAGSQPRKDALAIQPGDDDDDDVDDVDDVDER